MTFARGTQGQANDFMLDVARGVIPAMSHVNKFGENVAITKNTTEDIWDGSALYTFPTTADITHAVQAVDQAAMQGGALEVQGLDTNWAAVTQTVLLDAADTTTAVALTTALKRVFRVRVLEDVVTDQAIHLKNVGAGTTYATILAGNNQTAMAIYTVPADKTAYMTDYYADSTAIIEGTGDPETAHIKLWVADRANGYEFQLKHARGCWKDASSAFRHPFTPYLKITEKCDIRLSATISNDKAAHVHAGFDLILVDN